MREFVSLFEGVFMRGIDVFEMYVPGHRLVAPTRFECLEPILVTPDRTSDNSIIPETGKSFFDMRNVVKMRKKRKKGVYKIF